MNLSFVCFFLLVVSYTEQVPQTLTVTVVEGTLHVEYTLVVGETGCNQGDVLDVKAHISWHTEKEKTTHFSLVMKGTPYTQSELSEKIGTPIMLESYNSSSRFESEDISEFWDSWFDDVSLYGVFSDYSRKVLFNWNEVEITLHEDEKGRVYSLKATYYDFFTKFYPTPEAFFDERELDFQLIFGIHHIIPTMPLSLRIELPEEAEVLWFDPLSFTADKNVLTLTGQPDVEIPNVRIKFKMGRYKGTELPRLQVSKEVSSSLVEVGDRVTITIRVQNASSSEATEVRIQDMVPEAFELVEGETTLYVQTLKGQEEVVLTFTVKACNAGDYVLRGAQVEFRDQFGKTYSAYSDDIFITVVKKSAISACIVVVIMMFIVARKRR